jgi:hypothetical protein
MKNSTPLRIIMCARIHTPAGNSRSYNIGLSQPLSPRLPHMVRFLGEMKLGASTPVSRQASAMMWESGRNRPNFSVNVIMAGMVLVAAALAPILDSWLATIATTVSLGGAVSMLLSFYDIDVPWVHVVITTSSMLPVSTFPSRAPSYHYPDMDAVSVVSEKDEPEETESQKSSIHEPGYNVARDGVLKDSTFCVLFSESSRVLSEYAGTGDFTTCYLLMKAVSESIVQIWHSLPTAIGPPSDMVFLTPSGIDLSSSLSQKIVILPDDMECIRSGWNLLRGKSSGDTLKVLATKLSHSITKWPVVCSIGLIKAPVNAVYKSLSRANYYNQVDEFSGEYRPVEYVELSPGEGGRTTGSPGTLVPASAPLFIKYHEMKSVWPVQPRDYLAAQTGFDIAVDSGSRVGKMMITKSVDPYSGDPFPAGQEGYVRGALTASSFLILENKQNKHYSDVWTFLHCDMKGNLSGNGKIADFITQSQMPKFFEKLESVTIQHMRLHSD